MKSVSVLNFSGVYEKQNFYKNTEYEWVDCSDLTGVNGFCDDEAAAVIGERIKGLESPVHFIDGGNFHYLSYLMIRERKEPFTLVVFDHHTDMKPSMFEELLSCGCWIKRALDDCACVTGVILIGVADELAGTIGAEYEGRVRVISESETERDDGWLKLLNKEAGANIYLSIDKDAFSEDEVVTDWDQGSMTLDQLKAACRVLADRKFLGADVCGEAESGSGLSEKMSAADGKNDEANRRIAGILKPLFSGESRGSTAE